MLFLTIKLLFSKEKFHFLSLELKKKKPTPSILKNSSSQGDL